MPLSLAQQTLLGTASRTAIAGSMGQIRKYWALNRWLVSGNRYQVDSKGRIKKDTEPNRKFAHNQLREYISASSVTHCFDGWSFFARAISAELAGDPDAARHLAYYAELRAAMSLLAAEGIGAFDAKHIVVTANGRCQCLSGEGTHRFVWDALKFWASTPAGARTVFNVIRPGGIALHDWLSQFSVGASFVATNWLLQWGLDLNRLTNDRDSRNLASYRPTPFTSPGANSPKNTLANIRRLWEMCEPVIGSPFPVLDRNLLRLSLELSFRNVHAHGRTYKQAKKMYARQVQMMLHGLNPRELSAPQWLNFLTYADSKTTPQILIDAGGTVGPEHPDHSKQVLARALLLLRIATGASQQLMQELAGFNRDELKFWWSPAGESRGFWADGSPPATFSDLWQDVADAFTDLDGWVPALGQAFSYNKLWREKASAAMVLCSVERTSLWGLGL